MPIRLVQWSFNGGEVSPQFEGRADHQRYFSSLLRCENWVALPVGGVRRRPGTRFLAEAKHPFRKIRLIPFEFSVTQAYTVELGHEYVRFFKNRTKIEMSPGTPLELPSPYQESELFELQFSQSADTMWIVHQHHAPRKLLRFSDTQWRLDLIPFDPPPSAEAPIIMPVTLALGAVSGNSVTATAGDLVFLDGDVGRELSLIPSQGSQARATITALNFPAPTNNITINILSPFPSTALPANTWRLDGPLGSGLHISDGTGLKGTPLKVTLRQRGLTAPELLTNGTFAGGLTNWANHSGGILASGTHTGGSSSANLQDAGKHFPAFGVRVGMRLINTSSGNSTTISAITPDGRSLVPAPPGLTFNPGQGYQVIGSGGVEIANGGAQLSGGAAGIGWIEQAITTVPGQTYQVLVDVEEGPISIQVGSTSKGTDWFPEASYPIGVRQEAIFVAFSTTSYVQIRNNQPTMSRVKNVRARSISAHGFRPGDVGSFIKTRNGVLEIAGLDNAHSANVIIRTRMDAPTEADVIAGAWTLEVPAWSASRGFPRCVSFHQQRLGFAGTIAQPLTVWQSEIGNYEQFGASALADSSLEQEFSANSLNPILWMEPFRDLLVGTPRGEHLLRGVNGPLTPTNGEQLPQSAVGSQGLPPLRADNGLILLMRGGRSIRELEYDENGAVVRGKDHTLIAEHITAGGIVQWALQSRPTAIIWAVRGDGELIGLTYEQFEQIQGWHRHTTRGDFESVCVVPIGAPIDEHTEDVYLAAERFIGGVFVQVKRYIEVLDHTLTLDCAITYEGPLTTTIGGLAHLEGETVVIVDKSHGDDQPAVMRPKVVLAGEITGLEHAVSKADIGLQYDPTAETLRPEIPTRQGSSRGVIKRWAKLRAYVLSTSHLLINGQEAIFRVPSDPMDEGLVLRSGEVEVAPFGNTRDGRVTLRQTQPLPCTIIALAGELEIGED